MSQSKTVQEFATMMQSLQTELGALESYIESQFHSDYPFIHELINHISQYRGKRLRPVLVFLAARCFKGIQPDHVPLAGIIEMIHTATLVHDDVIDEADMRRRVATVNQCWSEEVAVLLGDYLFSHAFHLSLGLSTNRAAELLSSTTNTMVGGELLQVDGRTNYDLTEEQYYQIIGMKTAALTATSSYLGALYAGASEDQAQKMRDYGYQLGMAFQIVDDYLDIMGEENRVGKTLGTDLQKGKMTLPVIRLLSLSEADEKQSLLSLLQSAESGVIDDVLRQRLESTGAVQYTFERAQDFVDRALASIESLPESGDKDVLRAVCTFVLARRY